MVGRFTLRRAPVSDVPAPEQARTGERFVDITRIAVRADAACSERKPVAQ
jgi:hypothetical protein